MDDAMAHIGCQNACRDACRARIWGDALTAREVSLRPGRVKARGALAALRSVALRAAMLLAVTLLAVTLPAVALPGWGATAIAKPDPLHAAVARAQSAAAVVGLYAVDLDTGEVLLNEQAQTAANLASNAKLLSTAAALHAHGADHRFVTEVRARLSPVGMVFGHLQLVGGGDPALEHKQLEALARAVAKKGVKAVEQGILVDDSRYGGAHLPPAFEQKDEQSAFRTTVSALGVDSNRAIVSFKPGALGAPPRVRVKPSGDWAQVDNRATTVDGKGERLQIETMADRGRTVFIVTGTIGRQYKGGSVRRRIEDPAIQAGSVFADELADRRVFFHSNFVGRASDIPAPAPAEPTENAEGGPAPAQSSPDAAGDSAVEDSAEPEEAAPPTKLAVLARHESPPLADIVATINQTSDNAMAETLFLSLGATGRADWQGAANAVTAMFEAAGAPTEPPIRMANGSGLYDAVFASAEQVVALLRWANAQPWGDAFRTGLAVTGQSGTLKNRMKGSPADGAVFAKTGTLADACTLSGYLIRQDGHKVAFSFLFNGLNEGAGPARAAQDALALALR